MTKSIGLIDNKASESDKGTQIQVKLYEIVKERKNKKKLRRHLVKKLKNIFHRSKMNPRTIQVCVFLSLICGLKAFSITSAEVQGDGKEETRPAKEGSFI